MGYHILPILFVNWHNRLLYASNPKSLLEEMGGSEGGEYLAVLPPHPKLAKMLITGAFFRCFDLILTIVDGGIEWIYISAIPGVRLDKKDSVDPIARMLDYPRCSWRSGGVVLRLPGLGCWVEQRRRTEGGIIGIFFSG
ncbi:hypothetical protein L1987_19434 [Smallanthus sonchifolius]|uniref:Uncharacterized protein n=1 Tax=Smallanthus sonchifolius TaxID=185202 RepID=A0ACB9IPA3_9ASTR|nr:hypothetical protein L1987_19434 [Smallanthus sonchifolius]